MHTIIEVMLLEAFDSKSVDEILYKHKLTLYINVYLDHVYAPPSIGSTPSLICESSLINTSPQDKEPKVQATQPSTKQPLELKNSASYIDNVFEELIGVESIASIHEP
jgi:hypothetical protein